MQITNHKIIRSRAEHLVYRYWLSSLVPLNDFEDAKRCAVIAVEELYDGKDRQQLIDAILSL